MLSKALSTPRRQAPLGVVIIFLMNLRKWVNAIIFGAIPFLRGSDKAPPIWMFYAFAALLILILIGFSYLQWKNYFFHIEDGKFVIKQGVLRKEETLIALERIQSVHIKRNLVQQILNLAGVQLDTAGSAKKEAEIPALEHAFAEELKQELIALKEEITQEDVVANNPEELPVEPHQEKEIMRLSVVDLLKVGLTENHLQSGLVLLGIFFGYTYQISDLLGLDEGSIYEQAFKFALVVLPLFVVGFLLISVLVSLGRVFLRYFELIVALKKTGMSVKSGLLKREENFVPVNKIQFITWRSNPLRKIIGYKSLAVYQASSQEVHKKKTVRVPGCKQDQQEAIEHEFYPEYAASTGFAQFVPDAFWKWRLWFFFTVLPLAAAIALAVLGQYQFMGAAAFVVVLSVFFVHQYAKRFKAYVNDDLLVITKGYVYPEQTLLKLYKVQNVAVKQSIFQKRRGLVTLRIYTAAGSLNIPFIPQKEGLAIANKLLYTVEASDKKWM